MMDILDGMTREQALGCLCEYSDEPGNYAFSHGGKIYGCPEDIGLTLSTCPNDTGAPQCRMCWQTLINAYYDQREKPRWVEPYMEAGMVTCQGFQYAELYRVGISVGDWEREIERTNARRKIEAFIVANGGSGIFHPVWNRQNGAFGTVSNGVLLKPGSITCASYELTQEVIRRFPEELRLLAGVK
jgi:hypothetical protein